MLSLATPSFRVAGLSDEELGTAAAHAGLALRTDELRRIAGQLGRDPTTVEVHAFDAQWSEHCSYKSTRELLRRLPTSGPQVLLGPGQDAGALHFTQWQGRRYAIVVAHESHNHPSQVVPFEGAATGVGGIVRDVLCMGATVIGIADALRFGRIENESSHQRYVARSVVEGIAAYGNAIGVPNVAGDVYFDGGFDDNALVNVIALGLVAEDDLIGSVAPADAAGWDIVLVGKATDRSGFGGASFSSGLLDAADRDANKGAVQVPDPFLKNVLMRASYRVFEHLRASGVRAAFKDLGAGGLLGCTAELVSGGGFGATIELDRVPLGQDDLPPWVIAVGETQERLAWALPPHMTPAVLRIYNEEFSLPAIAQRACATIIGRVERGAQYVLRFHGETVLDVPADFLTTQVRDEHRADAPSATAPEAMPLELDPADYFEAVLAHRDVCSREPLFEQYDSVVRGTTAIARGQAAAGVILPLPGSAAGVALAVAGNPRYGRRDPRAAAELAVCEANRRVASVGARPLGLTDCLNFGDPANPRHFGAIVAAIEGLRAAATACATPFVSGNVSLYNEAAAGGAVPASPVVACVGVLDDISRIALPGFIKAGSALFLLGESTNALGGSVIAELCGREDALPSADASAVKGEIEALGRAIDGGSVSAVGHIADGGLLSALARMSFASAYALGARLEPPASWAPGVGTGAAYFGERGGFVCEVEAAREAQFVAQIGPGVSVRRLGSVCEDASLYVAEQRFDVRRLREAWSAPMRKWYS